MDIEYNRCIKLWKNFKENLKKLEKDGHINNYNDIYNDIYAKINIFNKQHELLHALMWELDTRSIKQIYRCAYKYYKHDYNLINYYSFHDNIDNIYERDYRDRLNRDNKHSHLIKNRIKELLYLTTENILYKKLGGDMVRKIKKYL
jgi:hypothetical protein